LSQICVSYCVECTFLLCLVSVYETGCFICLCLEVIVSVCCVRGRRRENRVPQKYLLRLQAVLLQLATPEFNSLALHSDQHMHQEQGHISQRTRHSKPDLDTQDIHPLDKEQIDKEQVVKVQERKRTRRMDNYIECVPPVYIKFCLGYYTYIYIH